MKRSPATQKKREQRVEAIREAILNAAAKVVGRHGYAKASVSRIAEEAGLSHGMIYLYFDNQQDLFSQLLPHVGEGMLRYIAKQAGRAETVEERERLGLRANFEYLAEHPELHRILNEAAFFAPETHRAYLNRMSEGYRRSFRRGYEKGQLCAYNPEEFETLSLIFIGAREYLLERFSSNDGRLDDLPDTVKRTYLKAVSMAMGCDPAPVLAALDDEAGGPRKNPA